ncbi:unnamed protein product [Periconia digitata]|uniref:Uncharacterized protein n=1 Tax=Periconia digitata TaxID=1303443 RepID=A0A9W4XXQ3_9PLEO|nr:unnamed protein product [Periconia digitata]
MITSFPAPSNHPSTDSPSDRWRLNTSLNSVSSSRHFPKGHDRNEKKVPPNCLLFAVRTYIHTYMAMTTDGACVCVQRSISSGVKPASVGPFKINPPELTNQFVKSIPRHYIRSLYFVIRDVAFIFCTCIIFSCTSYTLYTCLLKLFLRLPP